MNTFSGASNYKRGTQGTSSEEADGEGDIQDMPMEDPRALQFAFVTELSG
jgi:hypothetical protein